MRDVCENLSRGAVSIPSQSILHLTGFLSTQAILCKNNIDVHLPVMLSSHVSPRGPSSGDDPPYSRTEYDDDCEEEERATAVWELRGAGVGPSATVTRTHTRRSVQHTYPEAGRG